MNKTLSTMQSKGRALRMKSPIIYRPNIINFNYDMDVASPLRDIRKAMLNSMLLDVDSFQLELSEIVKFYHTAFNYHPFKLRYYEL